MDKLGTHQTELIVMTAFENKSESNKVIEEDVNEPSSSDSGELFSDSRTWLEGGTPKQPDQRPTMSAPTPTSTPKKKAPLKRKVRSEKFPPYPKGTEEEHHEADDKKMLHKSINIPSSLPNYLTISPHLTPQEKLKRRIRTFSQQSNSSQPCFNDGTLSKKKTTQTQKLIHKEGSYYLDKARTCRFHFMNDFLSQSHAETLLSDCTSLITKDKSLNPKKLSIEFENFTTKEDDEFKLSEEGNDEFNELINHNAKKVKKSLNSLFDLDVSFEKILLKRFASEKERLPYQSYFDKDSNTVVAILTVGALRTLSLKTSAGKKITHQVPMNSGSLSVMSGMTQNKYDYSILKSADTSKGSICLIFIGSVETVGNDLSVKSLSSATTSDYMEKTTSEVDSSSEQGEIDSKVDNMSTLDKSFVPDIVITNDDPELSQKITKRSINTQQQSPYNGGPGDKFERQTSLELDTTVINCPTTGVTHVLPMTSLITCLQFMPSDKIDNELSKLGCSISGSENIKKKRLATKISSGISANSFVQQPSYENDEIRTHLAGMERVLVNTVKQLDKLTEEIVKLKENMAVNSAPSATKTNPIENLASAQLTKMLKDNTNALKSIKEQTSDLKTELFASSRQASEIEKTVQSTKKELNQWHNSAFFKEDSLLIKDIHDCIANGKLAVNIEPPPPERATTPISEEIARARASNSTNSTPRLVPASSFSQSSPPGQHTSTPPQADPNDSSRRPTFLNMTVSAERLPARNPPVINLNTTPQYTNSFSQRTNPSSQRTNPSSQRTNPSSQRINSTSKRTNSTSQRSQTQQPSLRRQELRAPRRRSAGWFSGSAPSTRKNFVTVLITDSMMRHSPEDALGTNHELHILHKTDTAGLLEARVRESLNVLKPDFIYVHLGINDFMQNKRSSEITANYAEFSLRISDDLPRSRVIFSLPTPTDRYDESQVIGVLHKSTTDWIRNTEGHKETEERRVHFNSNSNFRSEDWYQKKELFARDGVHLTPSGKDLMTRNFRFAIHSITRKIKQQQRGVTR